MLGFDFKVKQNNTGWILLQIILLTNLKWSLWIPDDQVCIITRGQVALQTIKAAELGCSLAEETNYIRQLKASLTGWSPEQRQACEQGGDGRGLMSGKQAAQHSVVNDNLTPNMSLTCFTHLFTGMIVKEKFTAKNLYMYSLRNISNTILNFQTFCVISQVKIFNDLYPPSHYQLSKQRIYKVIPLWITLYLITS